MPYGKGRIAVFSFETAGGAGFIFAQILALAVALTPRTRFRKETHPSILRGFTKAVFVI